MKVLLAMAFTAAALMVRPVHADCPYPADPPKVPDGASSTLQEMIDGQKAYKAYEKAINDYNACIDKGVEDDIAKAGDKLKPEQKADMQRIEAQKHNAAVDQLQGYADRLNEQIKVFKAKQKG